MRRLVLALAGSAALILATALPAAAHEEINPATITTGKPTFFTLSTANDDATDINTVTVKAPPGLELGGATRTPDGWSVQKSADQAIWSGGTIPTDTFQQFGFEIEGADQPGTLNFTVTLAHADGTSDDVTVPVTATAAGSSSGDKAAKKSSSSTYTRRANVALAIGGVALVLAIIAVVLGRRRPSGRTRQDW
ncbi:MAG TPA: hypothetical protein VGF22_08100 [Acidimicrobiales bacterium]|jgi:hypothetical protein